jgi:hypothetical protein
MRLFYPQPLKGGKEEVRGKEGRYNMFAGKAVKTFISEFATSPASS